MTELMARVAESSPKTKRLSTVALVAAILAVFWAMIDNIANFEVDAVIVSSVTALAMLLAGFWDFKHADKETYNPEDDE